MADGDAPAAPEPVTGTAVTEIGRLEDSRRRNEEAALRRLIGKRVRMARVWLELSQDEVATKAGVTRNFVSAIERGAQGLDAFRLRLLAAAALGLTLAELLDPDPDRQLSPGPGGDRR